MVCTAGTSGETLREECSLSASCFSGPIKSVCVQSYSNAAAEGIEMNWIAWSRLAQFRISSLIIGGIRGVDV